MRSISLVVAIFALALAAERAAASILTVSTYSMTNGNGIPSAGTFNYLDFPYNGSGSGTTPGSSLSGGTGLLTDGIASTANWGWTPTEYVGWKYLNPTITFNFASSSRVGEIDLYVSGGNGGLVGLPATINVDGISESFTTTPITSGGFEGVDKLSIVFGGAGLIGDSFTLQLFEGACSLYTDCVNYSPKTDPFYTDPRTGQQTTVEPWLMVSEVQFLSAVPEPATWAMMLIGFASIGFIAYRRQRKIIASQVAA
jgi:hypothetical protein